MATAGGSAKPDPFAKVKEVQAAKFARANPLKIRLVVPLTTGFGEKIFVSGSVKPLGNWDDRRTRRMDFDEGAWRTAFEVDRDVHKLEYRYKITHDSSKTERWEKGQIRVVEIPSDKSGEWEITDLVAF